MNRAVAAIAIALSIAWPASARANGRFPAASQLVVAPTDPSFLVLRTTFGLVFSRDAGATWDWVCESAVGFGANVEDPPIGITASGAVAVGMQEGLGLSTNQGCDWHFIGGDLDKQPIVDLVVRPDSPHTVVALASKQLGTNDAGDPVYASQVFQSSDDGATWTKLGVPLDGSYILETIEVAANDPHRLYASGVKGSGATTSATMFVSTNDGATWTARAVPFDPNNDRAPFVSGVDPTNADRVYVRTSGTATNNLFVSENAGVSFTKILTGSSLLGFALSADGAKIYVGGPAFGLSVGARAGFLFTHASDVAVECLARSGTTLYACSNERDAPAALRFLVGASTDDGATFTARLRNAGVRGPLACDVDASQSVCIAQWPAVEKTLGIDAGVDASAPTDASVGNDASLPNNATSTGSCGCGATPADAGGAIGLAGLVAALMLLFKRSSAQKP